MLIITNTTGLKKPRSQNKLRRLLASSLVVASCTVYATNSVADDHAIEVSGVVEVELGVTSFDGGKDPGITDPAGTSIPNHKESDIKLATVEISLDTQIADNVTAHILLLHEEDDTPLGVDEGIITFGNPEDGFYVSAGQMYVPFGSFDTNLVSDPLTLDLAETRESAMLVGFAKGSFTGSFYLFNGDISESSTGTTKGDNNIETFGFNLGFAAENMAFGFGYISSIGESDTLQEKLVKPPGGIKSYVGGITVNGSMTFGRFNLIAEYVTALDDFKTTDFDLDGAGMPTVKKRKPSAFNLELGMEVGDGTLALGFQGTAGAEQIGLGETVANEMLPESRILFGYSTSIADNTTISAEYFLEEQYAYSTTQMTTGSKSSTLTVQLAVEF